MLGSDPFHVAPDYSSAVLHLETNAGLRGGSVVFTAGAGTDWICHGIRDLCQLVVGTRLDEFTAAPLQLYRRLIDHHQLRWLHDGVFRMAAGAVLNAMWDLWAKSLNQPLWKLLVDLEPEFVADCIDWRNLGDALTREEAIALLQARRAEVPQREAAMATRGPKAYCTAGWLGLSDEEILATIRKLQAEGFDAFAEGRSGLRPRRGANSRFMRDSIGPDSQLMVDANQYWGLAEAKQHIEQYQPFGLKWIEEPIARDDVLGYVELAETFADASFDFACGEQAASPVIFKQLLKSGAIRYRQIDAVRVAGVNDVMAIILLAAKYGVPVCPHGGGIALCNMIQHYGMWTIAVAGHSDTQLVEHRFSAGCRRASRGCPRRLLRHTHRSRLGSEFRPDFIAQHRYPEGAQRKDRSTR